MRRCPICCSRVSKYDFSAGRSHIEGASNQTDFAQMSYQYGLNNLLTLYGGTMLADNYNAFTLGTGWNTRIGAISVDATQSHSKQDSGDVFDGQSYQIAYNKYLTQTATRFGLAAYRYSSKDYRTFNDHVWANNKTVIIVMKMMCTTSRTIIRMILVVRTVFG